MTKSELIDELSATMKLPKAKAEAVVEMIFATMVEGFRQDERIEIRGFGSFEMRHYRAYAGRNPRTGEPVPVEPKRLPFFKAGKELRDRANAVANDQAVRKTAAAMESPVPSASSPSTAAHAADAGHDGPFRAPATGPSAPRGVPHPGAGYPGA
jgi:integration host factor subunit beta